MNTPTHTLQRALGASAGLALVWVVAAALRPGSTFHLAPILVTLVGTFVVGSAGRATRDWNAAVVGGAAISLLVTGVLAAAGWLAGPSLLPFGGPAVEAIVFTLGAGAAGVVAGIVPRVTAS